MLPAQAAIWKERGLLTVKGSTIKQQAEILELLEAFQLPNEVAGVTEGATPPLQGGNTLAKKPAKTDAQEQPVLQAAALRPDSTPSPTAPSYTPEELEWAKHRRLERDLSGWLTKDNKLLIPGAKQCKITKHFRESFHLGRTPYSN